MSVINYLILICIIGIVSIIFWGLFTSGLISTIIGICLIVISIFIFYNPIKLFRAKITNKD